MENPVQKRLEAVRLFGQLNFDKNKELADLITLAAEICKVPIAMITLMDEHIQWIKCKTGVDVDSSSRENSFCKYLMEKDQVMVVRDAAADARFANNPYVTGDYAIRFYAGAPLITTSGLHLGSLCVFDQKPHLFTKKQEEMLAILSKQAMRLMELELSLNAIELHNTELRKQKEKIDTSERKLRAFFNSSKFCHMLIGKDLEVIDFNKATSVFVKEMCDKQVQAGKCVLDYTSHAYKKEFMACLNRAFSGKRSNKQILIEFEGKGLLWWNIFLEPVKDEAGNVTSVVYNATNINDQKLRMAEIIAQNESLVNIAYIQSHEYRRPVASILGLMELIKMDNQNNLPDEYLMMMDEAVRELDEKIKSVINHTQVISFKH